jgi:hypothetical protein
VLTRLIATQREIERVIVQVAAAFACTPAELRSPSHAHRLTLPRHLAMYIATERTGASYPTMGKAFGGRHHTTVMYAVKRVDHLRQTDAEIEQYVARACSKMPPPAAIEPGPIQREVIDRALTALADHLTAGTQMAALLKQLVAELPPNWT